MKQAAGDTFHFCLGRTSYRRTTISGWLLFIGFFACALLAAWLSAQLLPTYSHAFTPFLKWQDALVALCWYIALLGVGGCILVLRFFHALRSGHSRGMLTLVSNTTLIVRDLSPENLTSIFWFISTALMCFLAALCGLIPTILLGWTLHLSNPLLALVASGFDILLSLAGLVVTLPALSFIVIGAVGSISYCRRMGSPHAYQLTSQATLSIAGFALTIMYPMAPEAVLDLNMLSSDDQRQLLRLLRERLAGATHLNPRLAEEIEAALEESEQAAIPA